MPDGLSLVTKGIIIGKDVDFITIRVYRSLAIDIKDKKPEITVRPITKPEIIIKM